jgi:hypothetical protein
VSTHIHRCSWSSPGAWGLLRSTHSRSSQVQVHTFRNRWTQQPLRPRGPPLLRPTSLRLVWLACVEQKKHNPNRLCTCVSIKKTRAWGNGIGMMMTISTRLQQARYVRGRGIRASPTATKPTETKAHLSCVCRAQIPDERTGQGFPLPIFSAVVVRHRTQTALRTPHAALLATRHESSTNVDGPR